MKNPQRFPTFDRRGFIRAGLLGSTALVIASRSAIAAVTKPQRPPYDGLKLGMASYTFRKFTLEKALAMCQEAGAISISLKDFHLPYQSTKAARQEARQKVEAAGLVLASGGVIYMKNT